MPKCIITTSLTIENVDRILPSFLIFNINTLPLLFDKFTVNSVVYDVHNTITKLKGRFSQHKKLDEDKFRSQESESRRHAYAVVVAYEAVITIGEGDICLHYISSNNSYTKQSTVELNLMPKSAYFLFTDN